MTERLILGTVLQMSNTHPEMLAHVQETMRESCLADRAEREGVRIVGEERWQFTEYGDMVETGNMIHDPTAPEHDLIPEMVWEPRIQEEAKYVRITWEARAER